MKAKELATDLVRPPLYPIRTRMDDEAFKQLVHSVARWGVKEPIGVRPKGEFYEVIYGLRRFLAAQEAGIPKVPCLIQECDDKEALVLMLEENLQREDLNPVDEGSVYDRMIRDYNLRVEEIADLRGVTPAYISQRLGLLKGPEEIKEAVQQGRISFSVGRELARIHDPMPRKKYLEDAALHGATVEVVRQWVARANGETLGHPIPVNPPGGEMLPAPPPPVKLHCPIGDHDVPVTDTLNVPICNTDYPVFLEFLRAYRAPEEKPAE